MTSFVLLPHHKVAFLRDRSINEGKYTVILSLYGCNNLFFYITQNQQDSNTTDTRTMPRVEASVLSDKLLKVMGWIHLIIGNCIKAD